MRIANDSIYGLNASVFTNDIDRGLRGRTSTARRDGRAQRVPRRFGMAFGGFKQSGIGREGGASGCAYLETKSILLDARPDGYPLDA